MSPARDKGGYILVELLVTVVIVVAGILFVVDSFGTSARAARKLVLTNQAIAVAEELRMLSTRGVLNLRSEGDGVVEVGSVQYRWTLYERQSVVLPFRDVVVASATISVCWDETSSAGCVELPIL